MEFPKRIATSSNDTSRCNRLTVPSNCFPPEFGPPPRLYLCLAQPGRVSTGAAWFQHGYPERIGSKECALTRSVNANVERISTDPAKSETDSLCRIPPYSGLRRRSPGPCVDANRAHARGFRSFAARLRRLFGGAK